MHLGLFSLMPQRDRNKSARRVYAEMAEQVKLAEAAGFEIAWFAEHHFSNYCLCPSPLNIAAYMAGRTSRIRLGTAVLVLPLYEPLRMLEEIAMVDNLSDGRVVIGLGSGYQEYEFHKFGVAIKDSHEIFLEMLDIIEGFLTRTPLAYQGKHFTIPETYFSVRPLQPIPDIYVAGLTTDLEAQKRIHRNGYVPIVTTGWSTLEEMVAARETVANARRAAGLDAASMPYAIQQYIHVTDDRAEALDAADHARYVRRVAMSMRENYGRLDGSYLVEIPARGEPPLETIVANTLIGDAHTCAERLVREFKALKLTHLSCFFGFGGLEQKRVLRSIERFGAEVMPRLAKHFGGLDKV
ncbi:MAG: LLM class flavin-dependent oxidoreductase, partial [Alphaproteobacteria bacterium]